MPTYVKLDEGKIRVYTRQMLEADNPAVMFPRELTDALLTQYGIFPLLRVEEPKFDAISERPDAITFYQEGRGFVQTRSVYQLSDAEVWVNVRVKRNAALTASDWTQLPDANLSADERRAWAQYRTYLRDLPMQGLDPRKLDWPKKPGA